MSEDKNKEQDKQEEHKHEDEKKQNDQSDWTGTQPPTRPPDQPH